MICIVCAKPQEYGICYPIDEDLADTWGLSAGLVARFNIREGFICKGCGSNVRAQGMASAILSSKYGYGAGTLVEWVGLANEKKLKVLELNSCHELHSVFKKLKYLTYAEYGTKTEQDIENLTYKDDAFDLVLHSETLEHVDNPRRALDECRRVVGPRGLIIFTTPVVWSRKSRTRSKKSGTKIENLMPASYHGQRTEDYLVYTEFGRDIDKLLACNVLASFPDKQNYIFGSSKYASDRIVWFRKCTFYILEKIYERTKV